MVKEKLKSLRQRKGFTQQQLADVIHTTSSNYCRKENGEVKLTFDEWKKIANFLSVPVEEIYEDDSKMIINNNNSNGENSGLHSNYYSIPNSIIENLQDYISLLKKENNNLKNELLKLKGK